MIEGKKTVLYIDDNPVDRRLISQVLAKNDFIVLLAEEGNSGMKTAQEQKPDLILLDLFLPGMSGIEICKKLKKDPATQGIPVVFYSAMDTPKEMMDYAVYGARDYLLKKMSPEGLVAAIKSILR
jgi:CheY-like chemotaxis protein